MVLNGEVKGQLFSSQPYAKQAIDIKNCSLPLHRAQGEDCEDVQIVYVHCSSFRPI